ncbi:helix-turn-helix domain-containing protein [Marimonas arenosa]|uniref:XRE family transcriptional regulator n=1 Tax=Marimonas arenosa TaxID=1795305 RepID=A0AAE4B5M6_9RHOB|nr:XRE family transcriptional regulator [Marimonas arenosa]MDQ2091505.1 XRE family transcriptional regulator [Marimonas arenosa]
MSENVPDTLSAGLETYRIGPKLRALRQAKGLALAQLGEHTGLSAGMLSKIERGQVFPTLPTLLRIALVFGVGLDHFFADGAERPVLEVVRARDRLKLPNKPDGTPAFFFESLDFPVSDRKLEAYLAEFPAGAEPSDAHRHDGVELIYVMRGTLELLIHDGVERLGPGDSVYFDSGFDHAYRAGDAAGAQAMVVVRAG